MHGSACVVWRPGGEDAAQINWHPGVVRAWAGIDALGLGLIAKPHACMRPRAHAARPPAAPGGKPLLVVAEGAVEQELHERMLVRCMAACGLARLQARGGEGGREGCIQQLAAARPLPTGDLRHKVLV